MDELRPGVWTWSGAPVADDAHGVLEAALEAPQSPGAMRRRG
jgi:hypothetical protein